MAMRWSEEAEQALSRVPFFVRKRVRRRVEEEAARCRAEVVGIMHVRACQQRFLQQMEREVRGFQVERCFGPSGCPNRAVADSKLAEQLESLASAYDLPAFLAERVDGPLKLHHEFRIVLADCPNACSRPQIVDLGIIGALRPEFDPAACTGCGACAEACREGALSLEHGAEIPHFDQARCLSCGQCIGSCPSGALRPGAYGYRVLVGGKLGRHPQFGRELARIYTEQEVLQVAAACLDHFKAHNRHGERFGDILNRTGLPRGPLCEIAKKNGRP